MGLVLGGFCGLFLGYSLLCLIFGAEIDALHIYYKKPAGAVSRRAHPPRPIRMMGGRSRRSSYSRSSKRRRMRSSTSRGMGG